MLTLEILQTLWPNGDHHVPGLLEGMAAAAPDVFPRYGLNDDLTIAHAMAQFSVECGAGTAMEENLNYSAARLPQVWPRHFTADNAAEYANNPQKLANFVYGGKNGNAPLPSEDGWNYRGRGLAQLTGRANYQRLATAYGLDTINNPGMLSAAATALECGVAAFCSCGCLDPAKADNVEQVTQKLNGGQTDIDARKAWLARWKAALGVAPAAAVAPEPAGVGS